MAASREGEKLVTPFEREEGCENSGRLGGWGNLSGSGRLGGAVQMHESGESVTGPREGEQGVKDGAWSSGFPTIPLSFAHFCYYWSTYDTGFPLALFSSLFLCSTSDSF